MKLNPYLKGFVAKKKGEKEIKLWFDESGTTRAASSFKLFEPGQIPLCSESTPYVDYEGMLEKNLARVPNTQILVGKGGALWQVSIIPDATLPEERFTLVVSMSHYVGDAHTFYKLYGMLSQDAPVVAMNPARRFDVDKAASDMMGHDERMHITRAITNPFWEWSRDEKNRAQNIIFFVSEDFSQKLRNEHHAEQDGEIAFSDHTLLTHWWFNLAKPTVGFQTYQLRSRLVDCDLSEHYAGNYMNPIPFTAQGGDYSKPEYIEKSLSTGKRCGTDPQAALPGFKWDATFSTSNDLSALYTTPIQLRDGVKERLHLLYHDASDVKVVPSKLSVMGIFTARPGDEDGSNRRIGAAINAPRSLLVQVEASGIVDGEPIAKF